MASCTATRKDGQPCTAPATRTGLCAGHSGLGFNANPQQAQQASTRARVANVKERAMTLHERMARQLEADAAEIVGELRDAGRRGDWRATEALITRVHGRPVERVEVDMPADPLGVAAMSQEERQALIARVLRQHPQLASIAGTPVVHPDAQSLH